MFRRSLSPLTAGLFAGLILAWAPLARAGDPADSPGAIEDLATLERTLKDVAEQAIPKTVLVKAIAGPGQMGSGSGAIISPDGYILTCTHVVEIGQTLEVVTADGKSYKAKCLGRNERQDYSLIKIEAKGLPVFELGDSDTVKTGDWVVALGHPGGPYKDLQPAFAAGRVRALDMKLPVGFMKKYYNHAIMTDVPIFAGDSGGPLVDAKGRLVGINGAIVMINEMAFAIPLNQIKPHLADLKQGKNIEGEPPGPEAFQEMQKVISPEDYKKMTSRMFKNFGKLFGGEDNPLSKLFGGEDNPLSKMFGGNGENPFGKMFGEDAPDLGKLFQDMFGGGGKPGEGLDLQKLLDPDGPLGKLFGGKPGEGLDLGKLLDPDGPLGKMFGGGGNGEAPDLQKMFQDMFGGKNPFGEKQPRQAPTQTKRPYLGLRVANTGDVGGLLIEDVQAKGPAEAAGLRKGDLLLAIDGRSVSSMQALQQVMGSVAAGQKIKVKVLRTQLLDSELVERELTFSVTLGSR